MGSRIEIRYCKQCKWMLRSAWMVQELLSTFEEEISEIVLVPTIGGVFEVHANGMLLWDRSVKGGFPSIKQLKILVRDCIAPGRDLGHVESIHRKDNWANNV